MSANVRTLKPNEMLAHTNADIAEAIRVVADRIEAGDYGSVQHFVGLTVPFSAPAVRHTFGQRIDKATLIGILAMAQHEELSR